VLIAGSNPVLSTNLLLVILLMMPWNYKPQTSSSRNHRRNLLFKSVVIATRGGTKGRPLSTIPIVNVLIDTIDPGAIVQSGGH
jgi:hypothetical protein